MNSSLVTLLTYTDTAVLAGLTYYYVATSVNASNAESIYSNEISATIPTPQSTKGRYSTAVSQGEVWARFT
jgi:fibronectin type 3 domain-containing protein